MTDSAIVVTGGFVTTLPATAGSLTPIAQYTNLNG